MPFYVFRLRFRLTFRGYLKSERNEDLGRTSRRRHLYFLGKITRCIISVSDVPSSWIKKSFAVMSIVCIIEVNPFVFVVDITGILHSSSSYTVSTSIHIVLSSTHPSCITLSWYPTTGNGTPGWVICALLISRLVL